MTSARSTLVTGAGGGIGAATAVALADEGARLWLTYADDDERAERVAQRCRQLGATAVTSRLDLRQPRQIAALYDAIADAWGALDAVVNNGGICPYTAWDAIELDEWDAVSETNERGTFVSTRCAVPLLRAAAGDRAIVNVASLAGQVGGLTTSVHYAASKGAVLAMTRSFAKLLAPDGIRVNAVAPGPIETAITANLAGDARAGLERALPVGRLGRPEDVASVIALLASPASAFTTGATYDVNGGLRMD